LITRSARAIKSGHMNAHLFCIYGRFQLSFIIQEWLQDRSMQHNASLSTVGDIALLSDME